MESTRQLVGRAVEILKKEDFSISSPDTNKFCFNILARRESLILLLKLLMNIDGLNPEQASDMKRTSKFITASPLIIGERTRNFPMDDGVVYSRHGITALTLNTFENVISQDVSPVVMSSRGGYHVKIDGEKLKRIREELNISAGELAEKIGVSRTMVYSYENIGLGATLDTLIKLEEYLEETLAMPLEIFSSPEAEGTENIEGPERPAFSLLRSIGFEIHPIKRAPFDAITEGEEDYILTKIEERLRRELSALQILNEISDVAACKAFIISDIPDTEENLHGLPVIKNSELESFETQGQLFETLEQRR